MNPSRFDRNACSIEIAVAALAVTTFLAFANPAHGHHGRDFLLTQTAELPHAGQLFLLSRQDGVDEGDEEEIEFEPTLLYGVTNRFALEVHSHVAREGSESFEYESTSPALHVGLTSHDASWGLAASAEYEISSLGDHEDRAEARLIASRNFGSSLLAFNVIAEEEQEAEADVEWGWVVGYRRTASAAWSWGLEASGGFESDTEREGLVGLFFEPNDRWTLLLGAGTALGDDGPDVSIRTSLVWRVK